MTLDEAIEHAREISASDCTDCAKEHGQLAEWLSELRDFKKHQKHTVWKTYYKNSEAMIECSECGFSITWEDREPETGTVYPKEPMRYCPNCGAKAKLDGSEF